MGVQRVALQLLARGRAPLWPSTLFEFVRMPAAIKATLALMSGRHRPFTVTDKGRAGDVRYTMRAPMLLTGLLLGSIVSGAWYVATLQHLTTVAYQIPWVAHGSAVWVAVNAAFLLGALRRIGSERFAAERRAAVRFPVTGTAEVNGTKAVVDDLCVNGARALMPAPATPGARVWPDLSPLMHAPVRAHVRSSRPMADGHVIGLEFADLTARERAQLVLQLFQTAATPALTQEPKQHSRDLRELRGAEQDRFDESRWGGPRATEAAS
jgi:hypothetical protein